MLGEEQILVGLAVLSQAEHEEWIEGPVMVDRDKVLHDLDAEVLQQVGRFDAVEAALVVMKHKWEISVGQEGDIAMLLGVAYDRLEETVDAA